MKTQRLDTIHTLVLHHSASRRSLTLPEIDRMHRRRGFAMVGYHFVIEARGLVRIGRPIDVIPAAQKGRNTGTVAVCLVGDNRYANRAWSRAQIQLARELREALETVLGRQLRLQGHRDIAVSPTLCPAVDLGALELGPVLRA